MKVAFHLYNDGTAQVDYSQVEEGNPGCGGTSFLAVLIATLLCKNSSIDILLLHNQPCKLPKDLNSIVCESTIGAIDYCKTHHIDILVVDPKYLPHSSDRSVDVKVLSDAPFVKFVLWANNFISIKEQKRLLQLDNVVRIVNVGREEYDLCRDCSFFEKTTFIYNAIPLEAIEKRKSQIVPIKNRAHHVVYVGSLIKSKGFHILAKAWPSILTAVPDAELFVIGSGKLYNRDSKLGEWNIAEADYEAEFMKYLTLDGQIMNSVHFLGILGAEKYDVIAHCKVGVPNPSGLTETFGYTALEMQAMGCEVTTMECAGYVDTVRNKSRLYRNANDLAKNVIMLLLNDKENSYDDTLKWITANFSCDVVCDQWQKLLLSDLQSPASVFPVNNNFHGKYIKEIIRRVLPANTRKYIISIERFYPTPIKKVLFRIKNMVS